MEIFAGSEKSGKLFSVQVDVLPLRKPFKNPGLSECGQFSQNKKPGMTSPMRGPENSI